MFTFDPIDRRQYRFVMMIAVGLLVVTITNFEKLIHIVVLSMDCVGISSFCQSLNNDVSRYVSLAAITLFLITIAVATMRRISATPITNYWVVILSVLVFLDHKYLTGLDTIWNADLNVSILQLPIPWYLLSAGSLVILLSFASAKSSYFLNDCWNADPPLGFGLSVSSFWLLVFSSPIIILIIATATGNYTLWHTGNNLQYLFANWLPHLALSPIIPAVIFITCSLLLTILGKLKQDDQMSFVKSTQQNTQRRQSVMQTTKAAQSMNGLKL